MADTTKILMAIQTDVAYSRGKVDGIDTRLERVEADGKGCAETRTKLNGHLENHRFWNVLGISSALAAIGLGLKIIWSSLKGGPP